MDLHAISEGCWSLLDAGDGSPKSGPAAQVLRARLRRIVGRHATDLARLWGQYRIGQEHGRNAHAERRRTVTLLVKPVGNTCNLMCDYCFNQSSGHGPQVPSPVHIDPEILEQAIAGALQHADVGVHFIWHGGEPLLAGIDFFRYAFRLQRTLARPGQYITNSVQTNGSLVDMCWADLFTRERVSMSISLDGPRAKHDAHRRHASGVGSYLAAVRAIQLLRSRGCSVGTIAVLCGCHGMPPDEFIGAIAAVPVDYCTVEPCFDVQGECFGAPKGSYSSFMLGLFELWLTDKYSAIGVRLFDEILKVVLGYGTNLCYMAGMCSSFVCIDAGGKVWPCDKPFPGHWCFGDLNEISFADAVDGPTAATYARQDADAQLLCRDCVCFEFCHRGCPHSRLLSDGALTGIPHTCQEFRVLVPAVMARIREVVS